MSESAVDGGQSTPPDLASLSPSASPDRPVVTPSGAGVPLLPVGAQAAFWLGAVACGGVAGVGGAWASATVAAEASRNDRNRVHLMFMAR